MIVPAERRNTRLTERSCSAVALQSPHRPERVSKRRENRPRFIAVPPQSELNAFQNAVKTSAESFHSGNHTQAEFPESAVSFQSRHFLSKVGPSWNESAVFYEPVPLPSQTAWPAYLYAAVTAETAPFE